MSGKVSAADRGTTTSETTASNLASTDSAVVRRAHKVLNKKDRNILSDYLNSVDYDALNCAVKTKLNFTRFSFSCFV